MVKMKPDQERVKNLLLDTVTLLCKNSLQYENKLRVEGLLGVSVDESDVFFLHISEYFQNNAAVELNNACEVSNESEREATRDEQSLHRERRDSVPVKDEIHEVVSETDDIIITSSTLASPHTVAQPATVVAGQRRTPHKRPHSPSSGFRDSPHQQNSNNHHQSQNQHPLSSSTAAHTLNNSQMGSVDGDYSYSECGDGTSFDQLQGQGLIKQETGWDQEPAAKRHVSDPSPWPNLAGLGDLAAQAAQAAQDAEEGGGSYSQPGCSTWPSSSQILANSGIQDSAPSTKRRSRQGLSTAPPSFPEIGSGSGEASGGGRVGSQRACEVCGKLFADAYRLQRHFLIHTGEKPFACQHCGHSFNQKAILNRHIKKQHGLGAQPSLAGRRGARERPIARGQNVPQPWRPMVTSVYSSPEDTIELPETLDIGQED